MTQTLEAFCQLVPPSGDWKLIAVDNGSTDETAARIQSFADRLPLELLSVPDRGKNHALNAALEHIEGDLIVLTDDDVVPDAQWLCALQECADSNPQCGLFGGPILPRWPSPPEPWILKDLPLGMLFAITPDTIKDGEIDCENLWGPNMAVRRSIFDKGVRFNTSIGPDGSAQYMMGSETEFTMRLATLGIKGWFCNAAKVEHIIRPNQLSRSWMLQRFFRFGRARYQMEHECDEKTPLLFGAARWLYRRLIATYFRSLLLLIMGRHEASFKTMTKHYETRGAIYQSKQMHTRKARSVKHSASKGRP